MEEEKPRPFPKSEFIITAHGHAWMKCIYLGVPVKQAIILTGPKSKFLGPFSNVLLAINEVEARLLEKRIDKAQRDNYLTQIRDIICYNFKENQPRPDIEEIIRYKGAHFGLLNLYETGMIDGLTAFLDRTYNSLPADTPQYVLDTRGLFTHDINSFVKQYYTDKPPRKRNSKRVDFDKMSQEMTELREYIQKSMDTKFAHLQKKHKKSKE